MSRFTATAKYLGTAVIAVGSACMAVAMTVAQLPMPPAERARPISPRIAESIARQAPIPPQRSEAEPKMTRAAVNVPVKMIELPHPVREEAKRLVRELNAKRMMQRHDVKHGSDREVAKSAPRRPDRERMAGRAQQHPNAPALGYAPPPPRSAATEVFSPYVH